MLASAMVLARAMTTVLMQVPRSGRTPHRADARRRCSQKIGRARAREDTGIPPPGRPKSGQQGRCGTDARPVDLIAYLLAYLGAQATTTLTATPCRCGRNVARLSSSKTKVPPGLMA